MNDDLISQHQNTIEFMEIEQKFIYSWGFGKYGQIGNIYSNYSLLPIKVEVEEKEKEEIFIVSAGEGHSAVLSLTPKLYTFGKNTFGQLGLGTNDYIHLPRLVNFPMNQKIIKVSCGGEHTLALSEESILFSWGLNVFGQLGLGDFESRNVPSKVEMNLTNEFIIEIAAGAQHSMILTNKSKVFTCGYARNKSLGYDTEDNQNTFVNVPSINCKTQVDKIACGVYHSACIIDNELIYIWGVGDILVYTCPTLMNFLNKKDQSPSKKFVNMIKDIKVGEDFVVVLMKNEDIYMMGDNKFGQLGNKTLTSRDNFGKVENLKVKQIEVGYNFVIAVSSDKKVYGWGSNQYGQLGLTGESFYTEPILLQTPTVLGVTKLSCGGYHCIGLFDSQLDDKGTTSNSFSLIENKLKMISLSANVQKDLRSERIKILEKLNTKISDIELCINTKQSVINDLKFKEEELKLSLQPSLSSSTSKFSEMTRGFDNNFEVSLSEFQFQGDDDIGKGTFGEVKRAIWRKEVVAVKFLRGDMINSEDSINAFIEECTMLKNLRHPNILLFMGASTKPPNYFILTELCENGNLFELLHQHKHIKLSWEDLRRIALEIAYGMNYLHSFDPPILHRDLKSMNVLLDKNFQVKIADFGSTKFLDVQMTRQKGTFQWMAPEVIKSNTYTEKADVFSFGVIMHELATRTPPYCGVDKKEVARKVANNPEYRPTITKHIAKEWAELMVKCWDHVPAKRPNYHEIIDILLRMKLK